MRSLQIKSFFYRLLKHKSVYLLLSSLCLFHSSWVYWRNSAEGNFTSTEHPCKKQPLFINWKWLMLNPENLLQTIFMEIENG